MDKSIILSGCLRWEWELPEKMNEALGDIIPIALTMHIVHSHFAVLRNISTPLNRYVKT
jgi:hypothetical protein